MIKILIVDDSDTEVKILKHIFSSVPDFSVVGCASNGKEAIQMVHDLNPDIITMDLQMPIMDGLEATKIIMSTFPKPVVVISSNLKNTDLNMTFQAMQAGALSVLDKPTDIASVSFNECRRRIIESIRSMAEILVVKHRFPRIIKTDLSTSVLKSNLSASYDLVAIGASVGGPQVLTSILSSLSSDFPIPIVIVQHMTPGFITGFVKWLNENVTINVKIATDNEVLSKGTVYFAPDLFHLKIVKDNDKLISKYVPAPPVSGFCPSISVLFNSVAKACKQHAIGVLLTGMGNDGADGLLDLKLTHGHTITQDKDSCVVYGMASVANSLGAVDKIVEISQMAAYLKLITNNSKPST